MVSVVAATLGVGGSAALVAASTCGVSCPCDEAEQTDGGAHADDAHEDKCEVAHGDDTPCDDECPDDCPDCDCSAKLVAGLAPIAGSAFRNAVASSKSESLIPSDAPTRGDVSGIFRPPRSLG